MTDNKLVWILGFAGFISAADNWIVSPILPAIAVGFGVSVSQVSIILTAYMMPYGIMQPVYGFISDRWGKARILQWIVCGLALGTLGCAIATSLWMLCLWRIITGFFAAGVIAVSLAVIGDTVSLLERQKYVGRFMGIVFLGQGLSVGLGGIFANFISWRVAFIFFAVLTLCMLTFLKKLPKDASQPLNCNFFLEIKRVALTPKGMIIFPLALVTGFLLLGLYSYLGAFLHEIAGLDYVQVGMVVMFYGFACLLAGSQVGKFGQKYGHKKTIIIGEFLALCTALTLVIFPYWQAGWLATISLGFGYIFIQSTLATIAFDVATENKGLPSALIGLGLFGGGGLGTALGSLLLSQGSYQTLWLFLGAGIVILIFITAKLRFSMN
ncbi:MFS transporter [Sporomusa sp. KB1]|jgi:predicted MFS family arabinose efflux permease|uniref:MFS transporter n=1 Tax=Sporomusa sp. KB1 TaxID=943346 RepID=UPI001C93E08B|nr:MFS transporter [Sporomusa sp. KB1]